MSAPETNFYVTGGTLCHDAPSYVERQADKDLCDGLLLGEFCYVLTSRQMGKSSLMVRTAGKLREKGAQVVALDLTAVGQNLTPEQWYDGLAMLMGRQLRLEDKLETYWLGDTRLSPVQRFVSAIRDVVLAKCFGPLVIFVDEIDTVRSLPFSTDEFFGAIRECYNRRTQDSEFNRLTFCLLGVATPSDLIRDTRTTPFNIGRRIQLQDFTQLEARALAKGLGEDETTAQSLLDRVFYWTGGHPYLTQRLCQAIAQRGGLTKQTEVDQLCEDLFLSNRARERDDNLLFVRERLLRSGVDSTSLLDLYLRVLRHKRVADDEANPLVSLLHLAGITRVVKGSLQVRNRIYERVFDERWVMTNLPDAEVRRQRAAFRKGLLQGVGAAAVLLLLIAAAWWGVRRARASKETKLAIQNFGAIYDSLKTYEDASTVTLEMKTGEIANKLSTGFLIAFVRPNKLNLVVKSTTGEFRLVSDGQKLWSYHALFNQYKVKDAPASLESFLETELKTDPMLSSMVMQRPAIYDLLLEKNQRQRLHQRVQSLRFGGVSDFSGVPVYRFGWDVSSEEFASMMGGGGGNTAKMESWEKGLKIPIDAWVHRKNGLILQMVRDMTPVYLEIAKKAPAGMPGSMANIQQFRLSEVHRDIKIDSAISDETFAFQPPTNAIMVERFDYSRILSRVTSTDISRSLDKTNLARLIPRRDPQTPAQCVDLANHYNALLTMTWHPGRAGNDLSAVPSGIQTFDGIRFDVRGIVQLRGSPNLQEQYPAQVNSIKVGQRCQRLHFLHATGWNVDDGTQIGSYVVHYAGGSEEVVPITYGETVRDWNRANDTSVTIKSGVIAWTGTNAALGSIRLFKSAWNNPRPDDEVATIDYVSKLTAATPFLIAITVEP